MSFRTVVVTKEARISYKNRFLVVKQDIDEKYIHLSEIDTVIVDSISVSISSYLLGIYFIKTFLQTSFICLVLS